MDQDVLPIRVLLVEDSTTDALLVEEALAGWTGSVCHYPG